MPQRRPAARPQPMNWPSSPSPRRTSSSILDKSRIEQLLLSSRKPVQQASLTSPSRSKSAMLSGNLADQLHTGSARGSRQMTWNSTAGQQRPHSATVSGTVHVAGSASRSKQGEVRKGGNKAPPSVKLLEPDTQLANFAGIKGALSSLARPRSAGSPYMTKQGRPAGPRRQRQKATDSSVAAPKGDEMAMAATAALGSSTIEDVLFMSQRGSRLVEPAHVNSMEVVHGLSSDASTLAKNDRLSPGEACEYVREGCGAGRAETQSAAAGETLLVVELDLPQPDLRFGTGEGMCSLSVGRPALSGTIADASAGTCALCCGLMLAVQVVNFVHCCVCDAALYCRDVCTRGGR